MPRFDREPPLDPPEHPEPPRYAGECAAYVQGGASDVAVLIDFDRDGEIVALEVERPWVLSAEDWAAVGEAVADATSDEARAERAYDDWYAHEEARGERLREGW